MSQQHDLPPRTLPPLTLPPLSVERLWQFSLRYYAQPAVKEACLTLQNQFGGHVNLLLLLKWLDTQQLAFPAQGWQQLDASLEPSNALLYRFRDLRRQLKSHLPETLYQESLQFELQLEQQQQADLMECLQTMPLTPNHGETLTHHYCSQLGAESLLPVFST